MNTVITVTINDQNGACIIEEQGAEPATYNLNGASLEALSHSVGEAVSDYLQGLG